MVQIEFSDSFLSLLPQYMSDVWLFNPNANYPKNGMTA